MSTEPKAANAPKTAADKEGSISGQASVVKSTAVAPLGLGVGGVAIDRSKIKVMRMVSVPVLQCSKAGQYVEFIINSAIREAAPLKADIGKDGKPTKAPANVADVTDIATGAPALFIFSAVVKNEIEALYPKGDYVGKAFAVQAMDKPEGKKFRPYMVAELEIGA